MKKIFSFIILLCVFFVYENVYAVNYKSSELIDVNDVASVDTEHYYYSDITYSPDSKKFDFKQVKNKGSKSAYLSASILLFDENSINIGFISYCSRKDLDGEYAQIRVNANAISPLSIEVKDKYFVGDRGAYDVKYYAILDDNYNCRSIDNNKYEGLTIDEIKDGKVSSNYDDDILWISDIFKKIDFNTFISVLIGAIVAYIIIGLIVSLLYVEMYKKGLYWCFIPIANVILGIRLAFGYVVCVIYTLLFILSIYIYIKSFNYVLFIILAVIYVICLIVLVYKKISNKYRLFYVEDVISMAIKKKKDALNSDNDLGNQTLDLTFEDKNDDKLDVDLNINIDSQNNNTDNNSFDTNQNIITSNDSNNIDSTSSGSADVDIGNVAIDLGFPGNDKKEDNNDDPWAF